MLNTGFLSPFHRCLLITFIFLRIHIFQQIGSPTDWVNLVCQTDAMRSVLKHRQQQSVIPMSTTGTQTNVDSKTVAFGTLGFCLFLKLCLVRRSGSGGYRQCRNKSLPRVTQKYLNSLTNLCINKRLQNQHTKASFFFFFLN